MKDNVCCDELTKKLSGCFQKKVCGNWIQTCCRLQVFLLPCDGNTAFLDEFDNYFDGFQELNDTMAANTTPRLDEQVLHLDLCACVKTTRCSVQTTSDTLILFDYGLSEEHVPGQGVLSLLRYTLMSHNCHAKYINNHKYKDNTTNNNLIQQQSNNSNKDLVIDWLKKPTSIQIKDNAVEIVQQ